ncbi:MAG: DUF3567 domain-containing protein [Caldimonas sp.]
MQMLYNSDSYAVVLFEVAPEAPAEGRAEPSLEARPGKGGYELVDKFAGKEMFLSGALADSFRTGVDALIETSPSEEEMDDYIERFAALMQQPLVLH